jgi:uncharacterized protein
MVSPTTIPGSECHVLRSQTTGRDYEVSVWRPEGIDAPLPLLFVTDGNLMFPLATSTVMMMMFGSEIPPVQVVGVGYPVGGDLAEMVELREGDLCPIRGGTSNGAEGFFGFLREELTPWLEQRYSVAEDRTLYGASLGGLFALYVLLHHPGHFVRYIIVSPAVAADPGFFDDKKRGDPNIVAGAIVSLMAGEIEDQLSPKMEPELREGFAALDTVNQTRRIDALLSSSAYAGLKLTTTIAPDQTHFTMPFAGMATGLRQVFS